MIDYTSMSAGHEQEITTRSRDTSTSVVHEIVYHQY